MPRRKSRVRVPSVALMEDSRALTCEGFWNFFVGNIDMYFSENGVVFYGASNFRLWKEMKDDFAGYMWLIENLLELEKVYIK